MTTQITKYGGRDPDWDAPAQDAVAVTTSDTTDDPSGPFRAFYVGGAGNVKVITNAGSTVTFTGCSAGAVYPFAVRRVFTTLTTATNIIGLL